MDFLKNKRPKMQGSPNRKGRVGGDFGMRYRPHLDKYFLKPERQQAAKRSLEEEWEEDVKKCSHPRWRRTIFLGDTYFTCEQCGSRRRQAVEPTTFPMSRDEAEDWFEECYPQGTSPSSCCHDTRPLRNERLICEHQAIAMREQPPVSVAKADMSKSEAYCCLTARMHAATTVDSEVQALARRYTAALQVLESRLTRNVNVRNKEAAERQQQLSVPRLKVRDMVLGGYFYANVSLQRKNVFVEGAVWDELWLVHHRLRLMYPSLPRDMPTITYLEGLILRLFPALSHAQTEVLKATALDWIYTVARSHPTTPKRSLICCALIAMAAEIGRGLSEEMFRFLQDFDVNYSKWQEVISMFGQVAEEVLQRAPQPLQLEAEQWLDEQETAKEWATRKEELNGGRHHEGDARKAGKRKAEDEEQPAAKRLKKKAHVDAEKTLHSGKHRDKVKIPPGRVPRSPGRAAWNDLAIYVSGPSLAPPPLSPPICYFCCFFLGY
ncbi:hypothetical protein GWK47_047130 [Chionoecetes opilio]|uniref:Uncharacterized protein n=1 Tax=Chionoecetes opilio TaxID=41210 RepID=A0A8J5CT64_CHIOP|nr:hypothetical protein GWK47_047130 [Chionoecetes opilio]